jgi:hypothetical protein
MEEKSDKAGEAVQVSTDLPHPLPLSKGEGRLKLAFLKIASKPSLPKVKDRNKARDA